MSTARTIQMALSGAKSAYDTWSDYSDRKAAETYATLADAASQYGPKADAAVERAGQATQAARERLERSFDQVGQQARQEGKQLGRKGGRKAAKAATKAAAKNKKKNRKKEGGSGVFSRVALVVLALSVIGIVVYVLRNRATAPKQPAVADQASAGEVEEKLRGDDTFSDVTPDEVKVDHAEDHAEDTENTEAAGAVGDVERPTQDDSPAEDASAEEVEETLKGDDTFSDVEPEEVKVEHAEDSAEEKK